MLRDTKTFCTGELIQRNVLQLHCEHGGNVYWTLPFKLNGHRHLAETQLTYSMEKHSPPQKLKHPKLLKKFPAFYRTQRFITVFTRARHLSLSSARLIQSMPPYLSKIHFNIILPSTPGSFKWSLSLRFPH
jgi:hypothetical protein